MTAIAVLLVLYFVLPAKQHKPAGSLTGTETSAMDAAGTIAANLTTFSRKNFSADFTRALGSTTGELKADLSTRKNQRFEQLTSGKFDIYSKVQRTALVESSRDGKQPAFVVLVALNGYTSATPSIPFPQNFELTVERVDGKWVASDLVSVGIQ